MPIQGNLRKRTSLFMWENANNEGKENLHESTKGIGKRGLGKAERAQKETEKRAVSCGCIQTNWMMRILNLCGTAFSAMQRESPIIV